MGMPTQLSTEQFAQRIDDAIAETIVVAGDRITPQRCVDVPGNVDSTVAAGFIIGQITTDQAKVVIELSDEFQQAPWGRGTLIEMGVRKIEDAQRQGLTHTATDMNGRLFEDYLPRLAPADEAKEPND